MDLNIRNSKNQCPQTPEQATEMCQIPYREAVGSLLYLAVATCPDFPFPIGILSQFMDNAGWVHWEGVKHVHISVFGWYKELSFNLWEGERFRGVYWCRWCYAFLIDGGAISWSSKKQEIVMLSTTESEYVAATHTTKEAIWLRQFIAEVFQPLTSPIPLYSDSQAAITLTCDRSYYAPTKHIDIWFNSWLTSK